MHLIQFRRVSLFTAQILLLAAGVAGAVLGPGWGGPTLPEGVAPDLAQRMALERKELHLANAWHAIDRASEPGGATSAGSTKLALLHARAALGEGPASGFAWLALAWAERLSGRDGPAIEALDRSWRWAPQSRTLSLRRVLLASFYWPELDPPARTRLLAEMRFANQSHPAPFQRLLGADPRTAALWRIARARGLDLAAFPTSLAIATAGRPPAF